MHHPLKQGLRRVLQFRFVFERKVRVHHPLKQGLRLSIAVVFNRVCTSVRVHHPLKQGLRL